MSDSARRHNYYSAKNAESIIPIFKPWCDQHNFSPTQIDASRLGMTAQSLVLRLRCGLAWLVDNTKDNPQAHAYWLRILNMLRTRTKGDIIWLLPNDIELSLIVRPMPTAKDTDLKLSFDAWLASKPRDNERWPGHSLGMALSADQIEYFKQRQKELDDAGEYYMSKITADELVFVKISKYTYEQLQTFETQ